MTLRDTGRETEGYRDSTIRAREGKGRSQFGWALMHIYPDFFVCEFSRGGQCDI